MCGCSDCRSDFHEACSSNILLRHIKQTDNLADARTDNPTPDLLIQQMIPTTRNTDLSKYDEIIIKRKCLLRG